MMRSLRLAIAPGAFALACTSSPRERPDTAAAPAAHDPSLHAQHTAHPPRAPATPDSTFAALQARGALGMGVDQYTSTHTFEPLPDGGRITLRRNVEDSAGVEAIRMHLRSIADAFAAGDFATPGFVHAEQVPGTDVMTARRRAISYRTAPIANGGELIMTTSDPVALDAIHRFLAYQRREHRAGGAPSP